MEPFEICLIVVLVVCVLALFFIYYKKKKEDESSVYGGPFTPPGPVSVPPASRTATPVKPVSNQKNIYVFEPYRQVRQCPRCDGENAISRNTCCICGFDFTKGVRRV